MDKTKCEELPKALAECVHRLNNNIDYCRKGIAKAIDEEIGRMFHCWIDVLSDIIVDSISKEIEYEEALREMNEIW